MSLKINHQKNTDNYVTQFRKFQNLNNHIAMNKLQNAVGKKKKRE